ncbi:MAG TPA: hypothetical protein PLL32_11260 [Anaeromyxobacteraceae bacterium]|nr:hypothetical protein [Anaeromyxobacteraceae bacterium]
MRPRHAAGRRRPFPVLPVLPAALLAFLAVASSGGCASIRATAERDRILETQVAPFVYACGCGGIWAEVLKEIAAQGFSLVGKDRAVAGQPPQSGLADFFSQGFQTRESADGGIEVSSDWNRSWVRLRASGTAVPGGCTVAFTRDSRAVLDDPGSVTSDSDLEASLGLLRRVDPAAAARGEAGMPR